MKVSELIEKLQRQNPEAIVEIPVDLNHLKTPTLWAKISMAVDVDGGRVRIW